MGLDNIATHPIQTSYWASFRREWGNKIQEFPFGLITIHKLPLTPFSVAVFDKGPAPTKQILETLKDYAVKNKILFVKIEPNVRHNKKDVKILKEAGAVLGKTLFTPTTFYIDLSRNEDELLKSFHPKTRYNIRLAERKGVKISEDNTEKAFETYWKLTEETTKRQGFFAHSKKYHKLMWKHLHTLMVKNKKEPIAQILTATYKKQVLAAWVIFKWKNFIYYPYGASSDKHKEVMAPNLMMWEAIKWGKKHGAKTFDLWGREPGRGFTKFKEGYNPEVVEFLGAWDLVCSPLYWIYIYADKLRWLILRLKAKMA